VPAGLALGLPLATSFSPSLVAQGGIMPASIVRLDVLDPGARAAEPIGICLPELRQAANRFQSPGSTPWSAPREAKSRRGAQSRLIHRSGLS